MSGQPMIFPFVQYSLIHDLAHLYYLSDCSNVQINMNISLKKLNTIYQIKSKVFVLEFFSVRLFSKEIQFSNRRNGSEMTNDKNGFVN